MKKKRWAVVLGIPLLIGLGGFVYVWNLVSAHDETAMPTEKRDVAIVLGAALWEGKPSPALEERLQMALQLYKEKRVDVLLLSGGVGDDGISEAEGMKQYLVEEGVPVGALLLEEQARSTEENLRHARTLMKEKGHHTAYLVTHDYHIYRALKYAHKADVTAKPAAVHSEVLWMGFHKTRESLAVMKGSLFDW
ncbi:YdcF family protein [Mechercharimyces sp. CAU 1602]|uniref:YdcF family protein n=1 Tax=Mechercharimyces sp. CAU 1602 TaxID=2973933 RepID=UPI002162CBC1|nr:YdcF family protein [Mechercharimyces sp. CAU 1602]MCS1351733.1 YdcF family protein [Mechercharimyces sp. CAU 1602]